MKLEDLKKLCDEATPGPWNCYQMVKDEVPTGYFLLSSRENGMSVYDAKLIAAARTYLPKLIAVAEAAKGLCNALSPEERASEQLFPEYRDLNRAIDALEAE